MKIVDESNIKDIARNLIGKSSLEYIHNKAYEWLTNYYNSFEFPGESKSAVEIYKQDLFPHDLTVTKTAFTVCYARKFGYKSCLTCPLCRNRNKRNRCESIYKTIRSAE